MPTRPILALVPLLALALLAPAQVSVEPSHLDFDRHVRPILARTCFQCHGPDESRREADLRLDTRAGLFGDRSGYTAVTPGDPRASEVVLRISAADPDERMPPHGSGRELTQDEITSITAWVASGATWREHWAFLPPEPPPLPRVADRSWPRTPIDTFVLARLEREGLTPSPPADRRTLLRRVHFDLIGLPPTPHAVRSFVADESPDAYERVVDELLGSPAYGEHRARFWLDIARYGDTHGLHLDNYREMWPYRDWVIDAFNRNLPYDRFIIDQVAGDLVPGADLAQRVASGFNRAHVTTNEGGSIEEEVYVRNVVDRTSTFGTAFMGLTVGCAVCHDHKFDPISQREFYGLFAFFNNLDGSPLDGNDQAPAPVVRIPGPEQTARLAALQRERADLDEAIEMELARQEYAEPHSDPATPRDAVTTVWVDDALPEGARPEGDELLWIEAPPRLVHRGRFAMKRSGTGTHQHYFRDAERKLRIGPDDRLFAWILVDPDDPPRAVMLQFNDDGAGGWGHRAVWGEDVVEFGRVGTTERFRVGDLPTPGAWTRLEVRAEQVGLRPGQVVHGLAFTQFDGTAYWDEAGIVSATPQEAEDVVWVDDEIPPGAVPGGDGATWTWTGGAGHPVRSGTRSVRRSMGDGLNQDFFTQAASPLVVARGDRLFAWVWIDPAAPARSIQLQFHANDGWGHRVRWGDPAHGAGTPDGADFVASSDPPATGSWVRLEVAVDDVGLAPGMPIDGFAFTQVGGTVYWDGAGVRTWSPPDERVPVSLRAWTLVAAGDPLLPEALREVASRAPSARTARQERRLRDHYLRYVYRDTRALFAPLEEQLAKLAMRSEEVERGIPTSLVMKERTDIRPAFVLERGQYDQRRDRVARGTPAALLPFSPELSRDRLGLAQWLTTPSHPLTARVAVNHFWQQLFGTGLVKTSEDFGNQGERPSDPALLDWLATRLVADGWDVKRTIRRIVLSSTYRQTSRLTPELQRRDPGNRLLARGPRFRLDAEMLRDQALFVSGRLVSRVGGPSVKPPQPAGLWKAVGYVGSNTDTFRADVEPEKIYRRSLYTFWKRTAPAPQLGTFDVPSREECRTRRERTNTPLQALLLMNDPQYVEAARALAERVLRDGGESPEARARYAFELATCRPPAAEDLADLLELWSGQRAALSAAPTDAQALVAVGQTPPAPGLDPVELASWTLVASLILNLDEFVTKE